MPAPEWLMRFEINPTFLPLSPDNAEGLAETLDNLATTISVLAMEYRKGDHRAAGRIEVESPG